MACQNILSNGMFEKCDRKWISHKETAWTTIKIRLMCKSNLFWTDNIQIANVHPISACLLHFIIVSFYAILLSCSFFNHSVIDRHDTVFFLFWLWICYEHFHTVWILSVEWFVISENSQNSIFDSRFISISNQ